jgi:uncharacterized membrane protein
MQEPEIQNHAAHSPRTSRRWLFLALIGVALFFRFYALDRKVYWGDEVLTSLTVAGRTFGEVRQELPLNSVITAADLRRQQRLDESKGVSDVVSSLATDFPEHPPLYFVLARLWSGVFGDSVSSLRALSAVFGVLVLPCVFWLSRELFASDRAAWVAVSLVAVSPFHVLYAQEARQYSLLAVVILCSSAALLRAERRQARLDWPVYAASVAAGFYTHPLFALVVLAHGLYIAVTGVRAVGWKPFTLPPTAKRYALAALLGLVAYAPWLIIAQAHLSAGEVGSWFEEPFDIISLSKRWLFAFAEPFVDTARSDIRSFYGVHGRLIDLAQFPAVILEGSALYVLCRRAGRRASVFILALAATTFLSLAVPDLLWGGRRSSVTRYMLATNLAFEIAVAYLFAQRTAGSDGARRRLWKAALLGTLVVGAVSCAVSSQASAWWNKSDSALDLLAASVINAARDPLVVSDVSGPGFANTIALSNLLLPGTRLQLINGQSAPRSFPPAGTLFLISYSESMRRRIEYDGRYSVEQTEAPILWRLVPK